MTDWKKTFEKELQLAAEARAHGNEGRARVCARRAAGVALREYFLRHSAPGRTSSALDLLQAFLDVPGIPGEAQRAAEALTLRVNEKFELPANVDLIEAARTLCKSLLPGEFES
jgi:HEPN domain-containing protein